MKAIPRVYFTIYKCFFTVWFVLKDFILSIPFLEHDVSYLSVSEEKTDQLLKTSGNRLFKDLMENKVFSIEILFGSLVKFRK